MTRLILVRHGETQLGAQSRYSGQAETPLTPLGERQHAALSTRLLPESLGAVISSDLNRCRTLADTLAAAHGLQASYEPRLREASFGTWEGSSYAELMASDRAAMVAFNRDPVRVAPPGGESLEAMAARVRGCVEGALHTHKGLEGALVIVSHGGALQAVLCCLLSIPLERYWTLRVDPAALSILDVYPMGPIVAVLNDVCHLVGLAAS